MKNDLNTLNIYYYLPLDLFGQPSGEVSECELTELEFLAHKNTPWSDKYYVYESYGAALRRALD